MTLDQLEPGNKARVLDIRAGHGLQRRLSYLGIHLGDTVRLSGRGAFRGPLLVRVHGMQVALGRGVARHIVVEPEGEPVAPRRHRRRFGRFSS
jgi:ferrous iron transport protein A